MVNTHYLEADEGPPLILIHGGGGSAEEEWSATLEQMATEHSVLAPDLVGCGQVDRSSAAYTRSPEVNSPTRIMWESWDGYLPVKQAYQAHQKLPDSRLHIFGKHWHVPQREESEEFN